MLGYSFYVTHLERTGPFQIVVNAYFEQQGAAYACERNKIASSACFNQITDPSVLLSDVPAGKLNTCTCNCIVRQISVENNLARNCF